MRKTNVTRWCAMMIALLLILGSLGRPGTGSGNQRKDTGMAHDFRRYARRRS